MAEAMRRMHPLRLSYEMFGPRNPFLAWVAAAAERVRGAPPPRRLRQPVRRPRRSRCRRQIVDGLEAWRKASEKLAEDTFRTVYGSPALQAALGIDTQLAAAAAQGRQEPAARAPWSSPGSPSSAPGCLAAGCARLSSGRCSTSARRAAAPTSAASRRSAASATPTPSRQLTLAAFKALIREQYFMLLIDEEAALAAIPGLLPEAIEDRRAAFATLREVLEARGALTEPTPNGWSGCAVRPRP